MKDEMEVIKPEKQLKLKNSNISAISFNDLDIICPQDSETLRNQKDILDEVSKVISTSSSPAYFMLQREVRKNKIQSSMRWSLVTLGKNGKEKRSPIVRRYVNKKTGMPMYESGCTNVTNQKLAMYDGIRKALRIRRKQGVNDFTDKEIEEFPKFMEDLAYWSKRLSPSKNNHKSEI